MGIGEVDQPVLFEARMRSNVEQPPLAAEEHFGYAFHGL